MHMDFFRRSALFFEFVVASSSYRFRVPRACIRLPVWAEGSFWTATQTVFRPAWSYRSKRECLELYVVATPLFVVYDLLDALHGVGIAHHLAQKHRGRSVSISWTSLALTVEVNESASTLVQFDL